ncbi:glycoside hydrolase family 130 protein [Superficieibacter sp. HKU1]|uniref:glycoside hydrolase family 130 protein n=1 Tax=Superficieibacter sp. HKU1 TaxID=3031919 RepID=UPI0023E35081|nr:glycoside hydrolase family 130 protein [Superficieibacter sp. HKU1]WES67764.1 glycoside hydrolase family 130 protein [Superficieibacter sp. HKU1]
MERHSHNPLIVPADVVPSQPYLKVECAFNTGVTEYNGEIILLLRVAESVINDDPQQIVVPLLEKGAQGWTVTTRTFDRRDDRYDFSDPRVIVLKSDPAQVWLTSMSHLRLARSTDGVNFRIDTQPFITADTQYEEFGCEDARITHIEGQWYINYSAVSSLGISTALAVTKDFVTVEKKGLILCPDNRDVCFFPEKVGGKYQALTRPAPCHFGHPEIWICESPDMLHWGNHRHLLGRSGDAWDCRKSGGGAPVIKTDRGWLEIYHGVDADQRYCLGALLMDLNDPTVILAKSPVPLLEPTAPYEREGFFGNVVFTCGALVRNDVLHVWYGAADEKVALATMPLDALWKHLGLA